MGFRISFTWKNFVQKAISEENWKSPESHQILNEKMDKYFYYKINEWKKKKNYWIIIEVKINIIYKNSWWTHYAN